MIGLNFGYETYISIIYTDIATLHDCKCIINRIKEKSRAKIAKNKSG